MSYCKTCGTKDASLFYASVATYCKEHWRAKVRANRVAKIDHYRSFDRLRASMPHRVAARKTYQKTDAFAQSHKKANAKWIAQHPDRRHASHVVSNALRDGKLQRLPCLICGEKAEGHHPDYSRPLDVVWLCNAHHRETHELLKEAA